MTDLTNLNLNGCVHSWRLKGAYEDEVKLRGKKVDLIFDVYYCIHCLTYIKKERPCPKDLKASS